MGTKEGAESLDFQTVPCWDELFDKFGAYEIVNGDEKEKPYVSRKKVVGCLKEGSEADAKRAYNLLALMRVLLPNRRDRFPARYLNTIDTCHNKNWAAHFLDQMATDIQAYRNSKAKSQVKVGGCILFLQLFYMKKVSALVPPPNGDILQSVTQEMVQKFVKQHIKEDASSSGAGNKQVEVLDSVHDSLKKRLRELIEEVVDKFDERGVKASMGSYLSLMFKAMEAQHSRFLQNLEHEVDQSEGSESENEEPKSDMEDTNVEKENQVVDSLANSGETSNMEDTNAVPKSAMGGGNGREKDSVLVDKENEANNDASQTAKGRGKRGAKRNVSEHRRQGVWTRSQTKFN